MKITGSKQVKGFNIAKHNEFKHGSLFAASSDKLVEEGDAEGEEGGSISAESSVRTASPSTAGSNADMSNDHA